MRVLFLTSAYPTPHDPGRGAFVRSIARGLLALGTRVRVLVLSVDRSHHVFQDDGVEVHAYPYVRWMRPLLLSQHGIVDSIRHDWRAAAQLPAYVRSSARVLEQHLDEFQPQIVHAQWFVPSGWVASRVMRRHRAPLVTSAWGGEFYLPCRWPVTRFLKQVDAASAATAAVSRHLRDRAQAYGVDVTRMSVVPNSIDASRFSPDGNHQNGRRFVIGTARRLAPEKCVDDILHAVFRIPAAVRESLEVQIAGEGPQRASLARLAGELGIADRVRFLGVIPNSDMPNVYRSFDVFVNPSIQEGMATANLEAMACGVPVVAYRGSGNDEVVTDGATGRLLPSRDVDQLTACLTDLARQKAHCRALGLKAREYVQTTHSQHAIAGLYTALYQKCLESPPCK